MVVVVAVYFFGIVFSPLPPPPPASPRPLILANTAAERGGQRNKPQKLGTFRRVALNRREKERERQEQNRKPATT